MARLEDYRQETKLDARIVVLRQEELRAKRALARETKKREMPCMCQRGGYGRTQENLEEFHEIYETARIEWLAEHQADTETQLVVEVNDL